MATNPVGILTGASTGMGRPLSQGTADAPTPPKDTSVPTALPTGLCARGRDQYDAAGTAYFSSSVIDIAWSDLQSAVNGPLLAGGVATIQADLDYYRPRVGPDGTPVKAILRVGCGFQSPAAMKALGGGPFPYATNHGVDPAWTLVPAPAPGETDYRAAGYAFLPGGIPDFSNATFQGAYADLMTKLAARFGGDSVLVLVTMAMNSTQFSEPCNRQLGYPPNIATLDTLGITSDVDDAAFAAGWTACLPWVEYGVAVETAYNPAQQIKRKTAAPTTRKTDVTRTIALQGKQAEILGRFGLWANFSLVNPIDFDGGSVPMYQNMINARARVSPWPQAIGFQSETLAKFVRDNAINPATTVPASIQMGISWGSTRYEPPRGFESPSAGVHYVTLAQAAEWAAQMFVNAGPLTQDGTPPTGGGGGDGSGGGTGGWTTPDSAVISAALAPYFLAGCGYGDAGNSSDPPRTFSSTTELVIKRNTQAETHKVALQMAAACVAMGGTSSIEPLGTQERTHMRLPAGRTITLDWAASTGAPVRIDGADAFGLVFASGVWSSTATGPQVRAFLAGLIMGEGQRSGGESGFGTIMDDPVGPHVEFVQRLLSTDQAYNIATTMKSTGYHLLSVDDGNAQARLQAYPFGSYARCPGGAP